MSKKHRSPAEMLDAAENDPVIVALAREWIVLCAEDGGWADLDAEEAAELSAARVIAGVDRHWAGGLIGYLDDCADEIAEHRAAAEQGKVAR
ncbi:hypothetical protein [Nocardia sp. NPDC051750]|uniref:hypothetical protein n=1 Tax=Nocardia sp. NPDC051750 TaxID=3364325 RepID=UPI0037B5249A